MNERYGGADMDTALWEGKQALQTLYKRYLEKVGEKFGLSKTEMDILLFLKNNPEYDSASEIVQHIFISKAHVSLTLRSLQEKGYVQASYAGENRRTLHLKLLEKAEQVVEEGQNAQRRYYRDMMSGIEQEDRKYFWSIFRRILKNADAFLEKRDGD